MFKELEELIKIWWLDIRTISINNYDDVFELLINGHMLMIIKK